MGSGEAACRAASRNLLLVLVGELRDSRREPHAPGVSNQQHRVGALRGHLVERIVDPKITVRLERNSCLVGASLDRRRHFTDQRRKDPLIEVCPDEIAIGEKQPAPPDSDPAIGVDVGPETPDPPRARAGWTPLTAFTSPVAFDTGITPMPPSNLARKSRSCALTWLTIPIANRITAALIICLPPLS